MLDAEKSELSHNTSLINVILSEHVCVCVCAGARAIIHDVIGFVPADGGVRAGRSATATFLLSFESLLINSETLRL